MAVASNSCRSDNAAAVIVPKAPIPAPAGPRRYAISALSRVRPKRRSLEWPKAGTSSARPRPPAPSPAAS
jgi:hypothetical protein